VERRISSISDETHRPLLEFTEKEFESFASSRSLPKGWPGEELINTIVEHSGGSYEFIRTVRLLVEDANDPESLLRQMITEVPKDTPNSLYKLYSFVLQSRVEGATGELRSMIGTILAAKYYQAIGEETIATLMGIDATKVKTWIGQLSPFFYRDEDREGGIYTRHSSIRDFFTSQSCPPDFRVDIEQAHVQVGLACLETMIRELRFNICGLESSLVANKDIKNLAERVQDNIPSSLQYSCISWSYHVCYSEDKGELQIYEALDKFADGTRLLYWVEALSLMGRVPAGDSALRQILLWSKVSEILLRRIVLLNIRTFSPPGILSSERFVTS
jgi:hypothetical protein